MTSLLTRDDIIDGIREIIARLTHAGVSATIQIVGGAAIALTIDGDRPATVDVDGPFTPLEAVEAVTVEIAQERGWPRTGSTTRRRFFSRMGWAAAPSG